MAILSGGSWLTIQGTRENPAPVGNTVIGEFVEFMEDQPSSNPAMPNQDVLKLDVDGEVKNIGCPRALGSIIKQHQRKLTPGTRMRITYKGRAKTKAGFSCHKFEVETLGEGEQASGGDASFGFGANVPAPGAAGGSVLTGEAATSGTTDLDRRLAEARARRGV